MNGALLHNTAIECQLAAGEALGIVRDIASAVAGFWAADRTVGIPARLLTLTVVTLLPRIGRTVLLLSVNIDHIATLRQARRESFPDPVQAAAAVEQGGADGITVHLRSDRRHINDRDVRLLRQTVQTELTVEMAATAAMVRFARAVRPDWVTLVPEEAGEVTTTRGLNVVQSRAELARVTATLRKAGIRVCLFVDPQPEQVSAAAEVGAEAVELNTDSYSRLWRRRESGGRALESLNRAAAAAVRSGLVVNVGHGLDYWNVVPILDARFARGFSIGFAIVARAVYTGLRDAVAEMKRILEVYS